VLHINKKTRTSNMVEQIITSADGHHIQAYVWQNKHAKAWIHINHGMAEHAKRYHTFAEQLVTAGFSVVAHNHRGHGSSDTTVLGSFGESGNWSKVLGDLETVRDVICDPDLPYYMFAHSMGSFIVQSYLTNCTRKIDGVILSGSNLQAPALSKAGRFVAKAEQLRIGRDNSSTLLQFLSFGSFNQTFKPNRTQYDWLSRDTKQVDMYINDPLCGFSCSTGLWHEFLNAMADLFKNGNLKNVQPNLPILIMGGDKDPVGMMGKGSPNLAKAYEAAGQQQVSVKVYENGRHEMLNETNAAIVSKDIISWLESQHGKVMMLNSPKNQAHL
jgi:alpha-beta hydrolase superfamily lysophospholipase